MSQTGRKLRTNTTQGRSVRLIGVAFSRKDRNLAALDTEAV